MEDIATNMTIWRSRLTALTFIVILTALTVGNLCTRPPSISKAERRALASFPPLTVESVWGSEFMNGFEDWATDNFLLRDGLRAVKAGVLFGVFRQLDNNDIYVNQGHAAKINRLKEGSVRQAGEKFARLAARYVQSERIYTAVIPDKSWYMEGNYPKIDTKTVETLLDETFPEATPIDLTAALDLDSYYQSDLHWDQAKLMDVVKMLEKSMGLPSLSVQWDEISYQPFHGVYHGHSALPLPSETLTTLVGAQLSRLRGERLDPLTLAMIPCEVYGQEQFDSIDPYNIFLGGAQPLITLENPEAATTRELLLFRDSFASSLAPLLTPHYQKITLVDLRYFSAEVLPQFWSESTETDVLFLYGVEVLNQSGTLKA